MFVEFHDANAICTSLLVHSHLYFDAVFGVVSQDHNIAFSPSTLQGATETQAKAVWVRQLRQDCTRQHLPQFKGRLVFNACIGFRSCSRRCPSISSLSKSCMRVDAFHCMLKETEHDRGHGCSLDVPPKLQDKILGNCCDRQRFFLIDTFFVLFRSCLG